MWPGAKHIHLSKGRSKVVGVHAIKTSVEVEFHAFLSQHYIAVSFTPRPWKEAEGIFRFKQPTKRSNNPNLFCYKTLHVSGIFFAHHQEFSTLHLALVSFMQAESGWNCRVIDFLLNNQPDVLIIQIYSVIKLYMYRASSLPIIRSFLLYIRHW